MQHRTSSVDKELTQISIAVLGDADQLGLATRRDLPRHQTKPCGKITTFELESQIWTQSADHHPGPRLLETPYHEGLTEVRIRSHANMVKSLLHYGRQPQKFSVTINTLRVSLCESMRLDGLHEQTTSCPLSHDELVQLQRIAAGAGVAPRLGRQGHELARAA